MRFYFAVALYPIEILRKKIFSVDFYWFLQIQDFLEENNFKLDVL